MPSLGIFKFKGGLNVVNIASVVYDLKPTIGGNCVERRCMQ